MDILIFCITGGKYIVILFGVQSCRLINEFGRLRLIIQSFGGFMVL